LDQLARGADVLTSLPQARRQAVVLHPSFNFWLNGLQDLVVRQDFPSALNWARQIADFVWSEEPLSQRCPSEWRTSLDDRGGLRCPRLKGFVEFGEVNRLRPIRIRTGLHGAELSLDDAIASPTPSTSLLSERSPGSSAAWPVSSVPTLLDGAVEVSSRDPSLRVAWTDILSRRSAIDFFGVSSRCFPVRPNLDPYAMAVANIATVWPDASLELPLITRVIVPMDSGPDQRMAGTLPSRNGAIFVDVESPELMEEAILHEHAHIKLRHLQQFDPLMRDFHDDHLRVPVPWRPDPRPIGGIFEGVFVYAYVADYALRKSRFTHHAGARGTSFLQWIDHGLLILRKHAQLTTLGQAFIDSVASWHGELQHAARSL
jgi:hypothetical protein